MHLQLEPNQKHSTKSFHPLQGNSIGYKIHTTIVSTKIVFQYTIIAHQQSLDSSF